MSASLRLRSLRALVWALAALAPSVALAVACTASVPALNFGSYNVFSTSPLSSTTTLSVGCAKGASDPTGTIPAAYTIALSTGSSLGYAQRTLVNGADTLNYNLYTNSPRTLIWGDGTGGSQVVAGSMYLTTGSPSHTNNHTIFGQVAPSQNAAVGNYSDNILVTVTY